MQRAVGLRLSWPRKTQPLGLRGPTCVISPRCRDPSCPISGPWLVSPLQAAFCSLLKFPALFYALFALTLNGVCGVCCRRHSGA